MRCDKRGGRGEGGVSANKVKAGEGRKGKIERGKEGINSNVPHDLLLQRPPRDQPIHINDPLLSQPMRPIHRLQIPHRVPIMLHKHDRVRARQVQAQPTHLCSEQQDVDGGIGVECLGDGVSAGGGGRAVHAEVGERREVGEEEGGDDEVEEGLELAEDEDSVRWGWGVEVRGRGEGSFGGRETDAAVVEDLSVWCGEKCKAYQEYVQRTSQIRERKEEKKEKYSLERHQLRRILQILDPLLPR